MREPCRKALSLPVRPHMIFARAEQGKETKVITLMTERYAVHPGDGIELHEFVIELNIAIIGVFRDDSGHTAGDSGRPEAHQHAGTLVTLLNIEPAQIFKAFNRVTDSLVAEMCLTKCNPLSGKFTAFIEKRHEIPCQGGGSACRFCADNQI